MTQPGSPVEIFALAFPFSSPFAMLARAARDPLLWPHAGALLWQALWVIVLVRAGSTLFRRRVMKSGPAAKRGRRGGRGKSLAV
jgi:ABC-2 type transport system permease protein